MTADPARIARLPRWARELIEDQARRIGRLEGDLDERSAGSDTFLYMPGSWPPVRQPLGTGVQIEFGPDGGPGGARWRYQARYVDGRLDVRTYDSGLHVFPAASNHIEIGDRNG